MLVDTHCHLEYDELYTNIDNVLFSAKQNKIEKFISVGCDKEKWNKNLEIINSNENIYGALGLHPHYAISWNEKLKKSLEEKLNSTKKIKALGEIGLDYYYLDEDKDLVVQKQTQKKAFIEQLELGIKLNLPIIVHTRDAQDDTCEILENYKNKKIVIHCFSGTKDFAKKMLDLGFYLSFTGVITFKKADEIREVLRETPKDKIMIETDCPYLAPVPKRGKPNTPAYLKYIFDKCVELLDVDSSKLENIFEENTERFFFADSD